MPLQTQTLKTGIKNLLDQSWANTENSEQARIHFSNELGTLIDTFVRSGTVTVQVVTNGSSTTQTGEGTGSIT